MADIPPERMMLGGVLGPIAAALYTLGFTQLYFGLVPTSALFARDRGRRPVAHDDHWRRVPRPLPVHWLPREGVSRRVGCLRSLSRRSPRWSDAPPIPPLRLSLGPAGHYREPRVCPVRRHARDGVPHVLDYSRARFSALPVASQAVQHRQRRTVGGLTNLWNFPSSARSWSARTVTRRGCSTG